MKDHIKLEKLQLYQLPLIPLLTTSKSN